MYIYNKYVFIYTQFRFRNILKYDSILWTEKNSNKKIQKALILTKLKRTNEKNLLTDQRRKSSLGDKYQTKSDTASWKKERWSQLMPGYDKNASDLLLNKVNKTHSDGVKMKLSPTVKSKLSQTLLNLSKPKDYKRMNHVASAEQDSKDTSKSKKSNELEIIICALCAKFRDLAS